jgi:hypothetical protein
MTMFLHNPGKGYIYLRASRHGVVIDVFKPWLHFHRMYRFG